MQCHGRPTPSRTLRSDAKFRGAWRRCAQQAGLISTASGFASRPCSLISTSAAASPRSGRVPHRRKCTGGVMNAIHLHLLLNHVPVIGTVIAVLLLGYA